MHQVEELQMRGMNLARKSSDLLQAISFIDGRDAEVARAGAEAVRTLHLAFDDLRAVLKDKEDTLQLEINTWMGENAAMHAHERERLVEARNECEVLEGELEK